MNPLPSSDSRSPLVFVECLGSDGGRCPIVRACTLKRVISEARDLMIRPREALLKRFV